MIQNDRHPCFNAAARGKHGRIHLPVAPDCNVACAYCNRKTDCMNEARPGVCSRVLDPEEAAALVDRAIRRMPSLAVAGIAGPGDPLATPELTLRTFEHVRRRHPDLLLCLSTNGVNLSDYVADIKALGVGHVTVTLNAVSLPAAARIYRKVRIGGFFLYGTEAAETILDQQEKALAALQHHGMTAKVNTVVIPELNASEVEMIAAWAARYGVSLMNCISLIPVPGTPLAASSPPSALLMDALRERAGTYVPQMRHCARCRADAFGLIGDETGILRSGEELQTTRPVHGFC